MPVSELHHQVAAIALSAASRYGFALGGGNALIAHGVIDRPTQDIDLFTDDEHGVQAASRAVEAALRAAGYQVEQPGHPGQSRATTGTPQRPWTGTPSPS